MSARDFETAVVRLTAAAHAAINAGSNAGRPEQDRLRLAADGVRAAGIDETDPVAARLMMLVCAARIYAAQGVDEDTYPGLVAAFNLYTKARQRMARPETPEAGDYYWKNGDLG